MHNFCVPGDRQHHGDQVGSQPQGPCDACGSAHGGGAGGLCQEPRICEATASVDARVDGFRWVLLAPGQNERLRRPKMEGWTGDVKYKPSNFEATCSQMCSVGEC